MKLGIGRRKRDGSKEAAKAAAKPDEARRSGGRRRRFVLRGAMLLSVLALAVLPGSTFGDDELVSNQDRRDDRDDARSGEIDWELGLDLEGNGKDDDGLDEEELAVDDQSEDDTDDEGSGGRTGGGDTSSSPVVDELTQSGIPQVAMRAYVRAQETTKRSDPTCGLRWSLLAAIGRVESNHGRFGGAQLRADGYGTKPIRGIPLDGRPGVAVIRDTDDGRLDGDTVYDRAVGPMQFIPSSWGRVAADGNGDGREDPNNIFDATLGAASYLCSGDRNLRTYTDRYAAVRSYNHSDEYVRTVLALADEYERNSDDLPQVGPVAPSTDPPPNLPDPPGDPASVTPPPRPGNVGGGAPNSPAPGGGGGGGGFPPPGGGNGTTTTTTTRPPPPTVPGTPGPTGTVLPPCPTTTSSTSSTSSTTTTTTTGPTTTTTWPAHCPTTTTSTTAPTSSTAGSSSSSSSTPSTAGPVGTGVAVVVGAVGLVLAGLTGGRMLRRRLEV